MTRGRAEHYKYLHNKEIIGEKLAVVTIVIPLAHVSYTSTFSWYTLHISAPEVTAACDQVAAASVNSETFLWLRWIMSAHRTQDSRQPDPGLHSAHGSSPPGYAE